MEGTETGWGRPAEPAPRWRALLDRALLGSRTGEQPHVDGADDDQRLEPPRGEHRGPPGPAVTESAPLPTRPVNPLDRRARQPLDRHPRGPVDSRPALTPEQRAPAPADPRPGNPLDRPVNPFAQRPANPLEQRATGALGQRPVNPREPRPVNPLDRRAGRSGEGFAGRAAPVTNGQPAERPHSFFDPSPRQSQPPGGYPGPPVRPPYRPAPTGEPTYPQPGQPAEPDSGRHPGYPAEPAQSGYPTSPPGGQPGRRAEQSSRSFAEQTYLAAAPAPPLTQPAPPGPPAGGGVAGEVLPAPVLPGAAPSAGTAAPVAVPTAGVGTARVGAPAAPGDAEYPARIEWRQTEADRETERAVNVLRRAIGGPRVLAFANPKGGVHKTTATVLAAASVGSVRGRGVLAWDDNELRGTLGLRAGSARHARTIRHLITDLIELEALHGTELTDRLDDYLRHASDGSYDVLAGEESPRFAQRLDHSTVRRIMELLRRTHDVICVDTGNNVESVNWQTVLQTADQLVVTTVPREDAAFTADWMLDLLHEIGLGELADNAVTLLSCPTPAPSALLTDLTRHFATRTRAVAVVPYDPALETGSSIEYGQLQESTRQAWLRATAVMLEPFVR